MFWKALVDILFYLVTTKRSFCCKSLTCWGDTARWTSWRTSCWIVSRPSLTAKRPSHRPSKTSVHTSAVTAPHYFTLPHSCLGLCTCDRGEHVCLMAAFCFWISCKMKRVGLSDGRAFWSRNRPWWPRASTRYQSTVLARHLSISNFFNHHVLSCLWLQTCDALI